MNEYRILYGCGSRAKVLTVDSEEQLELKVLFHIGSSYLFANGEGESAHDNESFFIENFHLYNNPSIYEGLSIVENRKIYGSFYIVKRDSEFKLDSLSFEDIRRLTKTMILQDGPFVKFSRVSPRGHAARHEQAIFLSSLLNNVAVKETIEYCVDKEPESSLDMVKDFILEKVRLLLDEMVK